MIFAVKSYKKFDKSLKLQSGRRLKQEGILQGPALGAILEKKSTSPYFKLREKFKCMLEAFIFSQYLQISWNKPGDSRNWIEYCDPYIWDVQSVRINYFLILPHFDDALSFKKIVSGKITKTGNQQGPTLTQNIIKSNKSV